MLRTNAKICEFSVAENQSETIWKRLARNSRIHLENVARHVSLFLSSFVIFMNLWRHVIILAHSSHSGPILKFAPTRGLRRRSPGRKRPWHLFGQRGAGKKKEDEERESRVSGYIAHRMEQRGAKGVGPLMSNNRAHLSPRCHPCQRGGAKGGPTFSANASTFAAPARNSLLRRPASLLRPCTSARALRPLHPGSNPLPSLSRVISRAVARPHTGARAAHERPRAPPPPPHTHTYTYNGRENAPRLRAVSV